jgi:hypothetical protein
MIELIMYFGIGFLVVASFGLLFIPAVHNRAVRLTMKRLEASTRRCRSPKFGHRLPAWRCCSIE